MDSSFYTDWFTWLEKRSAELAKKDPLKLLSLTSDLAALLQKEAKLWQSIQQAIKGDAIRIAVQVGIWVSHHPDPLKESREAMRAMRLKYGEAENVHK